MKKGALLFSLVIMMTLLLSCGKSDDYGEADTEKYSDSTTDATEHDESKWKKKEKADGVTDATEHDESKWKKKEKADGVTDATEHDESKWKKKEKADGVTDATEHDESKWKKKEKADGVTDATEHDESKWKKKEKADGVTDATEHDESKWKKKEKADGVTDATEHDESKWKKKEKADGVTDATEHDESKWKKKEKADGVTDATEHDESKWKKKEKADGVTDATEHDESKWKKKEKADGVTDATEHDESKWKKKEKTDASQQTSLTIVSWGGAYTKSQDEGYHKPYTAKTGIAIKNVDKGAAAPAGIRSQVEAGYVTWDVVDVVESDAAILCDEGVVEEIDYESLLAKGNDGSSPSEDFISGLNGCFIPTIVYSTLFAFNSEAFGENAPESINDVFDLKKFPGKRALEKVPHNNLEWALIADGVALADIYTTLSTPEGINRAFNKLDTIKDDVIWWTAGAQPPQLLADREVSIASGYNGRFFNAIVTEKQPITILWPGQSVEFDGWVIPKGKLTDTVEDYLFFATDSQRLADQARWISYGPARKSSATLVSTHAETGTDMSSHMPTKKEYMKSAFFKNVQFWTDNSESLNERFNAWLNK